MKITTKSLTILLAITPLVANAQNVLPWWTIDEGLQTFEHFRGELSTYLPNGAFVSTFEYGNNIPTTGMLKAFYRNGNPLFSIDHGTPNNYGTALGRDRSGNLLFGEYMNTSARVRKLQPYTGAVLWSSQFNSSKFGGPVAFRQFLDDGTHIYALGDVYGSKTSWIVCAYDSKTGNLDWSWKPALDSTKSHYQAQMQLYGSNNLAVTGTTDNNTRAVVYLVALNTHTDWYSQFWNTGTINGGYRLAVSTTSNIYVAGSTATADDNYVAYVRKVGAGGWLATTTMSTKNNGLDYIYGLNVDKSEFVTAAGSVTTTTGMTPWAAQYNSLGAKVWEKTFPVSAEDTFITDVQFDKFGEIYLLSHDTIAGYLTKVSTSGVIRWTQKILPANRSYRPSSLTIFPNSGDILVTGYSFVGNQSILQAYRQTYQQAPVCINDGYVMQKNTTYKTVRTILDNDRFPLGLVVKKVQDVSHGTLALQGNGHFTYTPASNFTGADTFKYQLTRPGFAPSTATVQINVN